MICMETSQPAAATQNVLPQGQQPTDPPSTAHPVLQQTEDSTAMSELEQNKRAIYRHPLFPLMALLFEKCEYATQAPHTFENSSSNNFDVDIQSFMQHQERDNKQLLTGDNEMDHLMVKAIQVLRIHLLELEKVNDLCKDFCTRYITCLKGKLQSENLLRTEFDDPQTFEALSSGVVVQSSQPVAAQQASLSAAPGQLVSGNTVYQMVQTPQGLVAQPIQIQTTPTSPPSPQTAANVIHGSTLLSQIGASTSSTAISSPNLNLTNSFFDDDDDEDCGKKQKRGVLPKQATQVMKSWLFQHIVHPYPTEDEKRVIANQTNLTLLQVNNWFINARRRILQPMLDASNPDATKQKKTAKPSSNAKPAARFWPEELANLTSQENAMAVMEKTTASVTSQQANAVTIPSIDSDEANAADQQNDANA